MKFIAMIFSGAVLVCAGMSIEAQERPSDFGLVERAVSETAPVEAPVLGAGQQWVYRRTDLWKNEEAERFSQDLLYDAPAFWLVRWTILSSSDAKRKGSVTTEAMYKLTQGFDDSQMEGLHEALRFPLSPGKSWRFNYKFKSPKGPLIDVKQTATVKGWENVTVPAGTFRVLRVEHAGWYEATENRSRWTGKITETFLYAPLARRVVFHEYRDTTGRGATWDHRRDELVEMHL